MLFAEKRAGRRGSPELSGGGLVKMLITWAEG